LQTTARTAVTLQGGFRYVHFVIDVHRATAEELALLPDLEARADAMFDSLGFGPLPAPGSVDALGGALLVLVAGRPPTGFVRLEELGGLVHVEQLSVDPDHMRQGIGGRLIEVARQWAAEAGYAEMTLATYRDVSWNAPFYAAHGFVEAGSVDEWYARHGLAPEEPELGVYGTRVLMRLSL
jgi:GNAT superfamily N-acetyltransferase